MKFETAYDAIMDRVSQIDPVAYGKTRNFVDGDVTYLSPYISRGVISTKQLFHRVMELGHPFWKVEKFIQELAWRDYWQQAWIAKKDLINTDLKRPQPVVLGKGISESIVDARTGVQAIDEGIDSLYDSGYMHNHMRMYVASVACNVAGAHWKIPAQWMYYHLLDGDWASNALSWQWVAGSNAGKRYFANQANINKYFHSSQRRTFLDKSYEELAEMERPAVLDHLVKPDLTTNLPQSTLETIDASKPTLLYNYYNLDPTWRVEDDVNRVLLLEPSVFHQYPVSDNSIDFMLGLAKNIDGMKVFVGEFDDFVDEHQPGAIHYKEHPLNTLYTGNIESRDWMFDVTGYFPSFFAFWKKCKKQLKQHA
ncbi:MAG: FAD-binding domain-containing protein [Bacteroidota bacterium]